MPDTKTSPEKLNIKNLIGGCLLIALIAGIWIWLGIVGILIIGAIFFMIFLHELGHLITARRAGMKTPEFFIGFGPKIWSFKTSKTEYGIRALPLGAYVKIIGMTNLEEVDPSEEHLTYRNKPYRQKLLVASAGSIAHFLIAVLCLWILFGFGGFWSFSNPPSDWQIGEVTENSAAEQAGLLPGDVINSADGVGGYNSDYTAFRDYIQTKRPGDSISLFISRKDNIDRDIIVDLGSSDSGRAMLGILPRPETQTPSGPIAGIYEAGRETLVSSQLTVEALGTFLYPPNLWDMISAPFTDDAPSQETDGDANRATTIFGIARISMDLASLGAWKELLAIYALVNIFIGIFNMLPLPPLDGGHVVVATYEKLRSRKGRKHVVDYNKIVPYQIAVILFLLVIFGTALYEDIANPINIGR